MLSVADYTAATPAGILVAAPGDSPEGDGSAAAGPATDEVFPAGSIRYAMSTEELSRHGLEIAIARSALGDVQAARYGALASSPPIRLLLQRAGTR